jgi:3-phosphoshikimate 1-carboxyvinyltransferase
MDMSQYIVSRSKLCGEIILPTSKSQTLRAILFASLGSGKSVVTNYLPSPDAFAMIEAFRSFGATISVSEKQLIIKGCKIEKAEDVINAQNSGIVLRFCAAIGALASHPVVITGDYSIRHQRPMKPLLEALSCLGVKASSMRGDGYAPVIIQGPLHGGKTKVEGRDSQPVSALLIACAFANEPTTFDVTYPGELPWVDLTLHWFKHLGIAYKNDNYHSYQLQGRACYEGFEYTVPGDLSSCAFPVAAALITDSELLVKNVDMDDPQGDKELLFIFQKMGALIDIDKEAKTVHVRRSHLQGITVDINRCIDGITILAVVSCFAEGTTRITNASIARTKECNRLTSIACELRKMGADIRETEDGLCINKSELRGANLESYHDHRMCMSLAIAAMNARGDSCISHSECVAKTFPTFARDFQNLGANLEERR